MVSSITPPQTVLFDSAPADGALYGARDLQHEQQFAALLQNAPTERLDAQPAPAKSEILSSAANRLDEIARGLRADPVIEAQDLRNNPLIPGDPASASPPAAAVPSGAHTSLTDETGIVLENYRHLVTFSIRAQVATTGSTTTTKTFNQLMKGS
jgi:hypothetical protein